MSLAIEKRGPLVSLGNLLHLVAFYQWNTGQNPGKTQTEPKAEKFIDIFYDSCRIAARDGISTFRKVR